jgi:hypothetical protein
VWGDLPVSANLIQIQFVIGALGLPAIPAKNLPSHADEMPNAIYFLVLSIMISQLRSGGLILARPFKAGIAMK